MEMNRRALYNSLRMNWVLDPTLEVEPWQVEDYRALSLDTLFEMLEDKKIYLSKSSYKAFAEGVDTPEELTDALWGEFFEDVKAYDQVYLIIFELWRRLFPEKPCLSVFCDEIDFQIHMYDRGMAVNVEGIQDVLANLQVILDENVDNGANPVDAFEGIEEGCANNIEMFIHDFIAEQLDNDNYSYAIELLDGFNNYLQDMHWFEFLRARVIAQTDPSEANLMIQHLIKDSRYEPDLDLNLEILSFLVRNGEKETFDRLMRQTADLLELEEDFQLLVSICADFYHRMDRDLVEESLQKLLNQRQKNDPEQKFDHRDPQLLEFFKIISS